MIRHATLRTTVIAIHQRLGISELRRHRLTFNRPVQVPERRFHVHETSTADRTSIRRLHVLVVASMMDAVSTGHEHHRLWRGEHVLSADGTVAVRGPFDAFVRAGDGNGHAHSARL